MCDLTGGRGGPTIVPMDKPAASHFRHAFVAATKMVRERTGLSQQQMAVACGVDLPRYKQWERRTPLPHEFFERFCIAARIEPDDLFQLANRISRQSPLPESGTVSQLSRSSLRRRRVAEPQDARAATARKR